MTHTESSAPSSTPSIKLRNFHGADVLAIRQRSSLSRSEFADILGLSIETVRAWEKDSKSMGSVARALFNTLEAIPPSNIAGIKRRRFSPDEVRAMRFQMCLSYRGFAKRFCLCWDSIRKWEKGRQRMGAVTCIFLSVLKMTLDEH